MQDAQTINHLASRRKVRFGARIDGNDPTHPIEISVRVHDDQGRIRHEYRLKVPHLAETTPAALLRFVQKRTGTRMSPRIRMSRSSMNPETYEDYADASLEAHFEAGWNGVLAVWLVGVS